MGSVWLCSVQEIITALEKKYYFNMLKYCIVQILAKLIVLSVALGMTLRVSQMEEV